MKNIRIVEVKNYRGGKLSVPEYDIDGNVVQAPLTDGNGKVLNDALGNPIMKPTTGRSANVLTCLDCLLMDFPRNLLTAKHIAECNRLYAKLAEAREKNLDTLSLEDAQWDWLVSVLKNDRIGVQTFGLNNTNLLVALGAQEI